MADEALLQILRKDVREWNTLRQEGLGADLSGAILSGAELCGADLSDAILSGALLSRANLSRANLSGANLSGAYLSGADLSYAILSDADLSDADLSYANLSYAILSGALLSGAILSGADLSYANLYHTKFVNSYVIDTKFADLDLRGAEGLETVRHLGPSEIGIRTIFRSEGKLPEAFLLGCGVPESFIALIPALVGAVQPIQFHSCFISYSKKDEEFARRLHARMRQAELRVWFAPKDIKGGDYLKDQIDRAIQVHDRLLLVLSESSMRSGWVTSEILQALKVQKKEGRRKLFPIRLVDFETIMEWECFDADEGIDLAKEVRNYFILDFSNWKNHDDFEREFDRLYESLKAEA